MNGRCRTRSRGDVSLARARRAALGVAAAALLLGACDRHSESERLPRDPVGLTGVVRTGSLEPGAPTMDRVSADYAENEWTVYAGERLYAFLNCAGCHANGGGAIGPALADGEWLYGSAPEQIFATIWQGRPHGMPAFGQRIEVAQAWALVAYVRALAGLTPRGLRKDPAAHLRTGGALMNPDTLPHTLPRVRDLRPGANTAALPADSAAPPR